jgi:hypothetical protein
MTLVQRSLTSCLNKITKPPVWGSPGPYKACRETDDDDGDGGGGDINICMWQSVATYTKRLTL